MSGFKSTFEYKLIYIFRINDVWQDKLFAFTLIAILVLYVASIISFITK